ncbi:MAG: long-chain-acyl-CoA synthetase [Hyphomonadaceae bacterium]
MAMNLFARLKSDLTYVVGLVRLIKATEHLTAEASISLAGEIEKSVDSHAARTFIHFEGADATYAAFEARANKFAHWAQSIGLKRGDCIALFMENRPDYIAFWFGMSKLGVRTALINNNLTGEGLAHCLKVAEARAIVLGEDLVEAFASAKAMVELDLGAWTLKDPARPAAPAPADIARPIEEALAAQPETRPDPALREGMKGGDIALFIYTSGTTGLPKAAKITNSRALGLMQAFIYAVGVNRDDRVLMTLPLYHATGGMCGVGVALFTGGTLILERKFSASHFWEQAIESRATMLVYIGELGRYLMNQPPSALERSHHIVKGFGNGLRPDVWKEFVERTGIKRLVEFYGSTEGNVSFFNIDGKIGAVGRIPPLLRSRIKTRLVKFDVETEQPVRGPDGFCVEAEVNEPGEAIGPISSEPRQRFEGYNDEKQTQKKILRDVFATGDMWFRTGDLMKMDEDGYLYFVDRVGDTFRWKSENVSTGEVELAVSAFKGVEHAIVYGVPAPGYDGKAGMAAIVAHKPLDMKALYDHLTARLPAYARPAFIRMKHGEADTTGTFKYRKMDLVKDGFDPMKIDDPLFFADQEQGSYVPLTDELFRRIVSGHIRL